MEVSRVGNWVRVDTPAKLNLFLEVLAKRSDGFHEIETLMTAISICDTLYLTDESRGEIQLTCNWASGMEASRQRATGKVWGDLPLATQNLVYQAVERLRRRAGVELGATVHLVKRIPSEAGMGGASSDAAAALVAANEHWRLGWHREQLADVASEIGSDIPFFLVRRKNAAAVCRGRGEKVESIGTMPALHFVVAKPPVGLSTAAVYRQCQVPPQPVAVAELCSAIRRGDVAAIGKLIYNRLQEAARQLCPWIERLRQSFERLDLLGHQLSGSGTSYFGLCRSMRHARQVAGRLRGVVPGEIFVTCNRS